MVCIGGHFYFVEIMKTNQFKNCSINLNAQHTNGMTPFLLGVHSGKLVRLLDTVVYCLISQVAIKSHICDHTDSNFLIDFKFNSDYDNFVQQH